MKNPRTLKLYGLALAVLLLGGASLALADTTTNVINSFDSGTDGVAPDSSGNWFGNAAFAYDSTENNTPGGGGACYITTTMNSGTDTPMASYITIPPYDNLWWNGNGNYNLSEYEFVQFDIKWDMVNSQLGVEQFDTFSNWPAVYLPGWADKDYIANNGSKISGLEVGVAGLGSTSPEPVTLATVHIPLEAESGWTTITIPINKSQAGIDGAAGLYFHKWIDYNINWAIQGSPAVYFWIDNVQFVKTNAPLPAPIVELPTKPTPGLNVISSTAGNAFYDRQQARLTTTNGLSWVGQATGGNPVTYSFTINGFPQDPAAQYACEAYMMMAPNPLSLPPNALDWNETNCIDVHLQQGAGTTMLSFYYKTNKPAGATDILAGTVTNTGTALGTWSVKFTSDTSVTLTAPDNSQSSFELPADVAALFAESGTVGAPQFRVYLGMQANNAASMNKAVCYSEFSVTGVPSAMTDNFLADSTLDTNVWSNVSATGPAGVFVMPSNAAYWIQWNTPAAGFDLQSTADLLGSWTMRTNNVVITAAGAKLQLLTTDDIPVDTGATYFRLVKP